MLYLKGVQSKKLDNKEIISKVVELVEKKSEEIETKNNDTNKKSRRINF